MNYKVGANIPEEWVNEYRWKQAVAANPDPPAVLLMAAWERGIDNILAWFPRIVDDFSRVLLWLIKKTR